MNKNELFCEVKVHKFYYLNNRSSNHPPNYIFNFNIDIPLKYKSTYRSNQTSPAKSPGKLNNKKCKLSSITPRPTNITPKPTNSITPRQNQPPLLL